MTATLTSSGILTLDEAMQLRNARDLLKGILERVDEDIHGQSAYRAYRLGRLAESIDRAGDAVFEVLNASSAYFGDENARTAMGRPV